jgi:hypothetical protein
MLAELALVPDIFDCACHSSAEACDIHLNYLKEPLLNEVLVRDLRDGGWSAFVTKDLGRWHPKAKELIKQLRKYVRFRQFPAALPEEPDNNAAWCCEAVKSHEIEPVEGVIACPDIAAAYDARSIVCSVDKLTSRPWWQNRGSSARLARTTNEYVKTLRLVLAYANSLMFIDPHIDPLASHYAEFIRLLVAARRNSVSPLIEIHRKHFPEGHDSFGRPYYPLPAEIEERFRKAWTSDIQTSGLSVDIFIWDQVHDRYLISNLIGVSVPYGFAISKDPTELTTWCRLSRKDRDDVQREYDPAAKRHGLIHHFRIS